MNLLKVVIVSISCIGTSFYPMYAQGSFQKATQNYKDALVISTDNDTLRGQIDYKQWRQNPATISFRQNGGEEKTLTPKDIQEFRVEGDVYRAATLDLDVSPTDLTRLNDSPYPTVVKDTSLFLLLLVKGAVNLYYLEDLANKEHFFYQESGQPAKELGYYRYYHDPVHLKFTTRATYKGQLRVLAMSCTEKQLDPGIEYLNKEMVSFFAKLNNCLSGEEPVQVNNTSSAGKIGFSFTGGLRYTYLSTYETMYKTWGSTLTYRGSTGDFSPVAGLSLDYTFPRGLGKYALGATLLYAPLHVVNIEPVTTNNYTRQFADEYRLNTLQLMFAVRYSLQGAAGLKYFATAGPSLIYFIDPSLQKSIYREDYKGDMVGSGGYSYEFHPLVAGVNLGVGSSWRKYALELRVNQELANTHSGDGNSKATNMMLLLSYRLF